MHLWAKKLRRVAAAAGLSALSGLPAHGDAVCREYWRAPHAVEWIEQGKQWGARIVARDPNWTLRGLGRYATTHAACEACWSDQISAAVLWLSAVHAPDRDLERAVSPPAVARMMAPFPFQVADAYVHGETESVPVVIGDLQGRARAIDVDYRDGRSNRVIAFSAVKSDCLVLYGIAHGRNGAPLAVGQLDAFVSAIGVESYQPTPNPFLIDPPPNLRGEDFPLGDAFRRRHMDDEL